MFPDIQVQNALCGLDVWDKRTEGRWFWTDEQQSKTPHPSCNRYKQIKSKSMNKIFKLQFACGLGWILIRIEISNKSSTEAFFVVDNSNFKAGLSINSPWLTFLSPLSPKKTGCIKNLDQHHPGMRVGVRSKPNSSFSVLEISRLT